MAESPALRASREKVDSTVKKMVDDIDHDVFRKMQKEMYLCSARCCENDQYSMSDVQSCAERCSQPVQQAQNYIQQELGDFLERLQRCGMQCQDDIKDRVSSATTEAQTESLRKEMEGCIIKCADKYTGLVPAMAKRIRNSLSSVK